MIDEDLTAAKLKGYNCLVKFKDGEVLLLKSGTLESGDEADIEDWFRDVEKFINGCGEDVVEYFPIGGISITRDTIKYVRKI